MFWEFFHGDYKGDSNKFINFRGILFVFLSGNFQDGKRVSLSVYLGEFFDIHLFANGTVMQGDRR